ncbi:TolC family protein [Paraburkholderia bryophila]|uniref:Outer membrane protein TolC n=1 Tax=Paraburkholderia bryophila TaxID=420952 RepID=A0A7Y9W950_9BURK|nr:TolC family protein [Paraburkholderia bryophila]NYH16093.1 outer membrane protein TolC [Paraburkholderia bryophila]
MRRFNAPFALAILATAGLAGCATSSLDMAPDSPDRPWQPRTDASGAIVPGPAGASGASGASGAASAAGAAGASNALGASGVSATPSGGYTLPANPSLAAVPPPPALEQAHDYSLPELIDLAESANPLTRIAWNDARNAALAAGIAKSAYLPQLSAAAMGLYADAHGSSTSALGDSSATASGHGETSVLALNWLLFDFGGRAARVEAASQGSVIANIGFTAVHQQVIFDVSVAFYGYQAARARIDTTRQGLDNAEAILAAAQSRYKHGVGTVIEVAQANQNRAQAKLALVQAQGAESNSYLMLISAMGISPLSKPRIATLPTHALPATMNDSIEQIVSSAIARRPDVLSAYAAERVNLARVKAAESEFMPKVFVSASGAYHTGSSSISAVPAIGQQLPTVNLSGGHYGGSVIVGVTIPIYDGGLRSAVLAQARNDADSATTRLARSREEAVRQIVAAQNTLQTSLSAQAAAKELLAAAQTTYDAAFDAYRHGVGSVTDALLAQNQLLAAKNADADSYSGALSAAAALALATGSVDSIPTQGSW